MSLITRQSKGSRLTIQEMDNNLLYLESLSGNTNFSNAKIGSELDFSQFDTDGSLRFFGAATTYNDQNVDILHEISSNGKPLSSKMFINSGELNTNYAVDFYSNLYFQYGTINLTGYTELLNTFLSGTFTISFWIKPNNINLYSVLFSLPTIDNTDTIFSIVINDGIAVQHYNHFSTSPVVLNRDYWYHICYVQKNDTQGTLYVNNIPTIIYPLPISGLTNLYLGCMNDYQWIRLPSFSAFSNLRFYNKELTASQVSELYNINLGLSVNVQPTDIIESSDVLLNFKNLENSGDTLYNSCDIGLNHDMQLYYSPNFINGPIGQLSHGVYLPSFDPTLTGTLGCQRTIRFEMSHDWKIGTQVDLHMHISTNIPINSGETIIFSLEKSIQDISMVLNTSTLIILNSGKTYPQTSVSTYTFTAPTTIPAYSNLILDFDNIDMGSFNTVSTTGVLTLTRMPDTFPGSIFEIQSIRMHYEIDSTGSRQKYIK